MLLSYLPETDKNNLSADDAIMGDFNTDDISVGDFNTDDVSVDDFGTIYS